MTETLLTFLSQHPPFEYLPRQELEKIVSVLKPADYPADTILCIQGQTSIENLYIIYQGALELYFQEDVKKSLNGFLVEGDTFGGISMLVNEGFAIRTVRVHEKSRFYLLPRANFLDICERYEEFSDFFTGAFGKRLVDKSYLAIVAKMASQRGENVLPLINQPVESICNRALLDCPESTPIREAARLMNEQRRSAILVRNDEGRYVGIATDRDFREKVVAAGMDVQRPVHEIMASPLITIPEDAPVFEAILLMVQRNIKHLAVTDASGMVIGLTSNKRLMTAQGQSPVAMIQEIRDTGDMKHIFSASKQLPLLVKELIQGGARADYLNRMITAIADAVLQRVIQFALDELGPPPARFVFMIMGSEGRKEQTLKTDQDNAIIYEDVSGKSAKPVRAYFLKFGEKVCGWLDQAGYAYCNGEVMAQNPKWCQPLSVWKGYFEKWIRTPEPMAVMHSTIFFDFNGAYGDFTLTDQLRSHLQDLLSDRPGLFLYHLANNSLKIKPPLGFFRNFVVESKGEHRNTFDIKKAMTPIVDFARIYTLEHNLMATNTLDRLELLQIHEVLKDSEYQELRQAYRYLMQIRIVRQVTAITEANKPPDNYIDPEKLTNIEQKMLKEVFRLVGEYQQKLSVHFMGTY